MASEDRPAADTLRGPGGEGWLVGSAPKTAAASAAWTGNETLEGRLSLEPWTFDFFQAVRRLECQRLRARVEVGQAAVRVGESRAVSQDVVRFRQAVGGAACLRSVERYVAEGKPQNRGLFLNCFGLLPPVGPLGLEFSEFVRQQQLQHDDLSLANFLDLFNHRMTSLFYRAWLAANQAASFDIAGLTKSRASVRRRDLGMATPDVAACIGRLIGVASDRDAGAGKGLGVAKLHFAGRLVARIRNPEGLRAILESYLGLPVSIDEFVGGWTPIPPEFRSEVTYSGRQSELGRTLILGDEIWECQSGFRIRVGPTKLESYERLLPGGDSLGRLAEWVREYAGGEFRWQVQLLLEGPEVPDWVLGEGGKLGWTTWLLTGEPRSGWYCPRGDLAVEANQA